MALDHLAHLPAELERFVGALAAGPLSAPVAACPGWDVARLGGHVAFIHRWAAAAVATGESPARDQIPEAPSDGAALVEWVREGGEALLATLQRVAPDAPTWHPFPAPLVAGVWRRRQLHELVVHRWDAQAAIGDADAVEPTVASDGIDEYFSMMLERRIERDGGELPKSSLHVHCTDTAGEWLVSSPNGRRLEMWREHAKGDAALRGSAEALLLTLWGRRHASLTVDIVGDRAVAGDWLALGG